MKVFVDYPGAFIDRFVIRLKSANTNFKLVNKPLEPCGDFDPNKGNEVFVVLDDSYEIDMLIRMLEEFKRVNYAAFGDWRLKP